MDAEQLISQYLGEAHPQALVKLVREAAKQMRFIRSGNLSMRPADEKKIEARVMKLVKRIAKMTGYDERDVWNHIEAEAGKLPRARPTPGIDI